MNPEHYRLVRTLPDAAIDTILAFREAWDWAHGDIPCAAIDMLILERNARTAEKAKLAQAADASFVSAVLAAVAGPPVGPKFRPPEPANATELAPSRPEPGPEPVASIKRCEDCGKPGRKVCQSCCSKRKYAKRAKSAEPVAEPPEAPAAATAGDSPRLVTWTGICRKCLKSFTYEAGPNNKAQRTICPSCDGAKPCIHCKRPTKATGDICPTCRVAGRAKLGSSAERLMAEPVPVIGEEYVTGDGKDGLERGKTYHITRLAPAGWREEQAIDRLDDSDDAELAGLGGEKL